MKRAIFITIILGLIIGCSGKKRSNAQVNPAIVSANDKLKQQQQLNDLQILTKAMDVEAQKVKNEGLNKIESEKLKSTFATAGVNNSDEVIAALDDLVSTLKKGKQGEKTDTSEANTETQLALAVLALSNQVNTLSTQITAQQECNKKLAEKIEALTKSPP